MLVSVCFFAACSNTPQQTGEPDTGTQQLDADTSLIPEETEAPKELYIHSISELNFDGGTDTHGSVYSHSSLEVNYREQTMLSQRDLLVSNPMYPRIKQMQDGTYFMVFQQGKFGSTIYFATSKDGINYSTPVPLLSMKSIKNGTDTLKYMTADAIVLQD